MAGELQIERARTADLDEIAALEAVSFPSPWRREFFEAELRAPRRHSRVLRDRSGTLLGYCFSMYFLDEIHVNKIAVREQSRRRGLALLMMQDCISFAQSRGIEIISLEVRESNHAAREFYESLGFVAVRRRARYYPDGETAVVMESTVAEAMLRRAGPASTSAGRPSRS